MLKSYIFWKATKLPFQICITLICGIYVASEITQSLSVKIISPHLVIVKQKVYLGSKKEKNMKNV